MPRRPRNPLEFLPPRVSRVQMPLYVPEQGWHLTENVVRWREVEELRLCGVEVAPCPLDQRPIAEDPEPLVRIQLLARTPRPWPPQGDT